MSFDFLTRLYLICTTEWSDWAFYEGLNLGELYVRIPEVQKAEQAFSDALNKLSSKKDRTKLDDLCVKVSLAQEKQGFINGFRMAMLLCQETLGRAGLASIH